MTMDSSYIFRKEVDWSLLTAGLTIKQENQVVFSQIAGRFLKKGEKKEIKLVLNGKTYTATLTNEDFDEKFLPHKEIIQIRYGTNSDIAVMLRTLFSSSYEYIKEKRDNRPKGDRSHIKVPEEKKEFLAIYTTEYDDTYILEAITVYDLERVKTAIAGETEQMAETMFNYDSTDENASIEIKTSIQKVRKLNRKIGDNLKLLYGYRCQICGKLIGEEYGSHVVEAHHIDYFINSLNNDASNQMIVCPNHHKIIHACNPDFNRRTLTFSYENGYTENLVLDKHLRINATI